MLQYAVIANLIQFALHLVQIRDFAIGKSTHPHTHTITELPPCFMVGVISNLDSSVQKTFYHFSIVQSLWNFLTLFCFFNSVFFTLQQFCHIDQFHRVFSSLWMLTDFFFMTLVQLCSDIWSSQPSVSQAGDSDEIVLFSSYYFWSASPTFSELSLLLVNQLYLWSTSPTLGEVALLLVNQPYF